MSDVNPNEVATAAIQDLQATIDRLTALKLEPGADIAGIDARIGTLEDRQDDLHTQALRTIEVSAANQRAIAAVNAAAVRLNAEAATMKVTAADLAAAANVLTAAASLLAALKLLV